MNTELDFKFLKAHRVKLYDKDPTDYSENPNQSFDRYTEAFFITRFVEIT